MLQSSARTACAARSPSPVALSAASRTTQSAIRASVPISTSRPTRPRASAAQATQGPECAMLKSGTAAAARTPGSVSAAPAASGAPHEA